MNPPLNYPPFGLRYLKNCIFLEMLYINNYLKNITIGNIY